MSDKATMTEIQPVRVEVTVTRSPRDAFRLFTEEIHTWWPLATHSVGQESTKTCAVEGRVGGRIFERLDDGSEESWGTLLAWEPPALLRFTWHPGRPPETAQEVTVRFQAAGPDRTRVELVHRGWEHYGEGAAAMRDQYLTGWAHVLGECYGTVAGKA